MATRYSVEVSTGDYEIPFVSGAKRTSLIRFKRFIKAAVAGALGTTTFKVRNTLVPASGTVTLATCLAGTQVEVNGVTFLAVSGTPVVANNEFDISGADAADATSLALAVTNCTDARIANVLTATSTGLTGVVTVTANGAGYQGNGVTIKTLGVVASGTVTVASIAANDTVTLNGTVLTSKQQRATGTVTAASAVAADTVTINGVVMTAVAGAATLGTKTFSIDTGDTETGTSLKAQINAYAEFSGIVTATSSAGVVTIRAVTAGVAGNSIALATNNNTRLAKSGTALSGGIAVANNEFEAIGTDTQIATDLVRCIGASSTALVNAHTTASSAAGVVTIRAAYSGTQGNAITLASSDGGRLALAVTNGRLAGGTNASSDGAAATGTLTLTSWLNTQTVAVNGVTITANTNTQANNQVDISGDDTADAAKLALAINNSTSAALADVIATSAVNVVTVTARKGGLSGNAITLSSGQASVVANVARLAGGAVPTTVVTSAARLTSGSESYFTL